MNFADILDEWDNMHGNSGHQTFDKDAQKQSLDMRQKMRNSEYVRNLEPQDTIDLHGLTQEEAWRELNTFVSNAQRRGLRKILIVHGKGLHSGASDGVLGSLVHKFIEGDQRLGASGHPDRTQGGSGATWVVVRQ